MPQERLTIDSVLEDSSNAPLDISSGNGLDLIACEYPIPERDIAYASSADTEGELPVNRRYKNRELKYQINISEPGEAAATNPIKNTQCRVDTSLFTAQGTAVLSRVEITRGGTPGSAPASIGADTALKIVSDTTDDRAYQEFTAANSTEYTLSAYFYIESNAADGGRIAIFDPGGALKAEGAVLSTLDTWTRVEVTFTTDSAGQWRLVLDQSGAGAMTWYATALQAETASAATTYFDGFTPGCTWTSAANASTSTRPATGGDRFSAIISDLETAMHKVVDKKGTIRREVVNVDDVITFDLVNGAADIPTDWRYVLDRNIEAPVTLVARPFGRGVEEDKGDNSETTLPYLAFTDEDIKGDVSALGRLRIDEDDAEDQDSVTWGLRTENYSSAATAGLFYEAEGRTALGTTSAVARAGASGGGNNVMRQTDLIPSWQSIVSTQTTGAGAHLSHVGSYQVYARVYDDSAELDQVKLRFEWGEGDQAKTTINAEVSPQVIDDFCIVDLGQISLTKVTQGAQQWQGLVQAKSSVTGDNIDIDYLFFQPIDEVSGLVLGAAVTESAQGFSARDEFERAAGDLAGDFTTNGVTGATNATPIVITCVAHGLSNDDTIWIELVEGNEAANGYWTIANKTNDTFELVGSTGDGAWTSGGTVSKSGKTLPIGSEWYGTGDADDFTINTTDDYAQRTAVSDASGNPFLLNGRLCIAGSPTLTTVSVQADVYWSNDTDVSRDGVLARYTDINNSLVAYLYNGGSSSQLRLIVGKRIGGSALALLTNVVVGSSQQDIWWSIRLRVDTNGNYSAWAWRTGSSMGLALGTGYHSDLATGGTLETGKVGIGDHRDDATAQTRYIDNFSAWVPTQPIRNYAISASQSLEIRHDRIENEDSGGTIWDEVAEYRGEYLFVPPSGRDNKTTEFFIKGSRGEPGVTADLGIDDISANLWVTPRYLVVPKP